MANATGQDYAACLGLVFDELAAVAGVKPHSDALGRLLKTMHEDGRLAAELLGTADLVGITNT